MVIVANRVIKIDNITTTITTIATTIVTMSSICKRVQREESHNNCRIKIAIAITLTPIGCRHLAVLKIGRDSLVIMRKSYRRIGMKIYRLCIISIKLVGIIIITA